MFNIITDFFFYVSLFASSQKNVEIFSTIPCKRYRGGEGLKDRESHGLSAGEEGEEERREGVQA